MIVVAVRPAASRVSSESMDLRTGRIRYAETTLATGKAENDGH
ncbi:hypothetical protein ACFCP7_16555 [Paenibacillus elgii]